MSDLRGKLNRYGGRGLAWWIEGLTALIPEGLRERTLTIDRRIVISLDAKGVSISRIDTRFRTVLFAGSVREFAHFVKSNGRRLSRWFPIVLRVPIDRCLVRHCVVPDAAIPRIAEVLTLEFEGSTPLKMRDVYSGYALVDRPSTPKGFRDVAHVTFKTVLAEDIFAAMSSARVPLTGVEVTGMNGDTLPIFLSSSSTARPLRPSMPRLVDRLTMALTVATLVAGTATIGLTLWNRQALLSGLALEIGELQKKASAARRSIEAMQKGERDMANWRLRKAQMPLTLQLVNELSKLVPDHSYISELQISDGAVEIDGVSRSAPDLIGAITASGIFSEANFVAPITRDATRNVDRFRIRLKVRSGEVAR